MAPADILFAPLKERLNLLQLAREQGVSPPSTWRWAVKGVRGICLPTVMVGGKRITTRSAFLSWVEQVTAAANGDQLLARDHEKLPNSSLLEAAERKATGLLGLDN